MKPPGGRKPQLSALSGKKQEQRITADQGGGGCKMGATTRLLLRNFVELYGNKL